MADNPSSSPDPAAVAQPESQPAAVPEASVPEAAVPQAAEHQAEHQQAEHQVEQTHREPMQPEQPQPEQTQSEQGAGEPRAADQQATGAVDASAERVQQLVEQPVEQLENTSSETAEGAALPQATMGQSAIPTSPVVPPEPSVATTLTVAPLTPVAVPPAGGSEHGDGEGGEWELLLEKLQTWLSQNDLQNLWAQASRPVTALAALVGLLLVLRVYSAVLGALDSLPLVPGLLELAGVVWVVRYGVPKLLRSSERERLLSGLRNSWNSFRGKG